MDKGFLSAALNCIGGFQFWPEVVAVIGSVIAAWFTAWRTSRSEVLKSFRLKRMETYEDILDLFAKVSKDVGIVFSNEFVAEVAALELRVKSFGSKQVSESFVKAVRNLDNRRIGYLNKDAELESTYMPEIPIYDKDGKLLFVDQRPTIEMDMYEFMLEEEQTKRTPSKCELNELFGPVIDAIRKSSLKAKS